MPERYPEGTLGRLNPVDRVQYFGGPRLLCGCGDVAMKTFIDTTANPVRTLLKCPHWDAPGQPRPEACSLNIWEDALQDYVQQCTVPAATVALHHLVQARHAEAAAGSAVDAQQAAEAAAAVAVQAQLTAEAKVASAEEAAREADAKAASEKARANLMTVLAIFTLGIMLASIAYAKMA